MRKEWADLAIAITECWLLISRTASHLTACSRSRSVLRRSWTRSPLRRPHPPSCAQSEERDPWQKRWAPYSKPFRRLCFGFLAARGAAEPRLLLFFVSFGSLAAFSDLLRHRSRFSRTTCWWATFILLTMSLHFSTSSGSMSSIRSWSVSHLDVVVVLGLNQFPTTAPSLLLSTPPLPGSSRSRSSSSSPERGNNVSSSSLPVSPETVWYLRS